MAAITASMVKELREKTGAGMMDCKKALTEADGNMEAAVDELRKRGQAIANKKAGRATREGLVFTKCEGNVGVLVEINCESDFVARNEAFTAFGAKLAESVFTGGAGFEGGDSDAMMEASSAALDGKAVKDVFTETIAHIGENLMLGRVVRFAAAENVGVVTGYLHPPGKLGVLVELEAGKAETAASEAIAQLGRDLAMQVAAASPLAIDADGVPADAIERERAIYREQVKMEGKPEQIWDKIIDGKMAKFFKENCLLNQVFIKDADLTIAKLIEKVGKELGDTVKIVRFERLAVGATIEEEEEAEG